MDKFVNKDGKVILEIDDEGNEKANEKHFKDLARKKKLKEEATEPEEGAFADSSGEAGEERDTSTDSDS